MARPSGTAPPDGVPPDAEIDDSHADPDRTGLAGAPDPVVDDSVETTAADEVALARAEEERLTDPNGNRAIPRGVQVAAAWGWRFLVLAATAYVLLLVVARTQLVLVPVLVALLLSALLQPVLLGRAVRVHPLAVVLGIATGVLLAGIVGALVAAPLVAVVNTVVSYLSGEGRTPRAPPAIEPNLRIS